MKTKTTLLIVLLLLTFLWFHTAFASVLNGGFESGDFSDWNVVSGSPLVDGGTSNGGSYSAYFQSDGVIEQNLSVVFGANYTGYVYFLSGTGAVMEIEYINADTDAVYASSELPDGATWDEITTNFTTASENLLIRISHVSGNDGFVDDVSISLVATPTPSSTPTNTPTPSVTPTPSLTPTPTNTPVATPTPTQPPTAVYFVDLPSGQTATVYMTATAGDIMVSVLVLSLTTLLTFLTIWFFAQRTSAE